MLKSNYSRKHFSVDPNFHAFTFAAFIPTMYIYTYVQYNLFIKAKLCFFRAKKSIIQNKTTKRKKISVKLQWKLKRRKRKYKFVESGFSSYFKWLLLQKKKEKEI